jgi:hypothetical protein
MTLMRGGSRNGISVKFKAGHVVMSVGCCMVKCLISECYCFFRATILGEFFVYSSNGSRPTDY